MVSSGDSNTKKAVGSNSRSEDTAASGANTADLDPQEWPSLQSSLLGESVKTRKIKAVDASPLEFTTAVSTATEDEEDTEGISPTAESGAAPFFSPPNADFASLQSPVRRPIHTPYSSRKPLPSPSPSETQNLGKTNLGGALDYPYPYGDHDDDDDDDDDNSTFRERQQQPPLKQPLAAQVQDLDRLLTSPLVNHLGGLAANDDEDDDEGGLGPRSGNRRNRRLEDDDMSQEWDQLAQSESLLRQELESFQFGTAPRPTKGSAAETDDPSTTDSQQPPYSEGSAMTSSIPPAMARQRLDPLASPLLPFYLFPGGVNNQPIHMQSSSLNPVVSNDDQMQPVDDKSNKKKHNQTKTEGYTSSTSVYDMVDEKKEGSPPSESNHGSTSAVVSPRKLQLSTDPNHTVGHAEPEMIHTTKSSRQQEQQPKDGCVVVYPSDMNLEQMSLSTVSTFAKKKTSPIKSTQPQQPSPSRPKLSPSPQSSRLYHQERTQPTGNETTIAKASEFSTVKASLVKRISPSKQASSKGAESTAFSPKKTSSPVKQSTIVSPAKRVISAKGEGSPAGAIPPETQPKVSVMSVVQKLESPTKSTSKSPSKLPAKPPTKSPLKSSFASSESVINNAKSKPMAGTVTPLRAAGSPKHTDTETKLNTSTLTAANRSYTQNNSRNTSINQTFADDMEDEYYQQYDDQADTKALQMAKVLYNEEPDSSMETEDEHDADQDRSTIDSGPRQSVSDLIGKFQTPPDKSLANDTLNETRYHSQDRNQTLNRTQRELNDTGYHTADQYSLSDDEDRSQDLGRELNQLMMQSMPLFSPLSATETSTDEFSTSNKHALSSSFISDETLQQHPSDERSPLNLSTDSSFSLDPEISQMISNVEDQLNSPSFLPETSLRKKKKPRQSPAIAEGALQSTTGSKDSTGAKPASNIQAHVLASGARDDDDDDDMAHELNQLDSTQQEMVEMLDFPAEDYTLPEKPSLTPRSPPQLTDDLNSSASQLQGLAHPVPMVADSKKAYSRSETPHQASELDGQQCPHQETPLDGVPGEGEQRTAIKNTEGSETQTPPKNNSDLEYFHSQDPELIQVATSVSPVSDESPSGTSTLSDEATMSSSLFAVGSLGDGTINTVDPTMVVPEMSSRERSSPAADKTEVSDSEKQVPPLSPGESPNLRRQLNLSPVAIASLSESTPTQEGTTSGHPQTLESLSLSQVSSQVSPESQQSLTFIPQKRSSQSGEISCNTRTSTPLRSGNADVISRKRKPDSCRALHNLVRTPSNGSEEEVHPGGKKYFHFIEVLDDSPESSVPFAPDVWDFETQDLAKGATLTKQENSGNYAAAMIYDDDDDDASLDACMKELESELDQENARTDIVAKSLSRLKEMQQSVFKREKHILKRQQSAPIMSSSLESPPKSLPFAAMNDADRRRYLSKVITSTRSLRAQSLSPSRMERDDCFQHPIDITSTEFAPSSSTSLNARSINFGENVSQDNSRTPISSLLDVGDVRPTAVEALEDGIDSPRQKARQSSLSGTATPTACVGVFSGSHDSDDHDIEMQTAGDAKEQDFENLLSNKEDSKEKMEKAGRRQHWLCMLIFLTWLVVIGAVIGIGLYLSRDGDMDSNSSIVSGEASAGDSPAATGAPSVVQSVPPTMVASLSPESAPPIPAPVDPVSTSPTHPPTVYQPPTLVIPPGLTPVSNSTLALIELLVETSVDGGEALLDRTTPEYASLLWLSNNFLLESYSDQQKIQRFVLGTVYYSMRGDEWLENSRWMTDWDECTWFSRSRNPVCNPAGEFVNLELSYMDVSGTIPKALGMLSSSLERIDIGGGPTAFITGTIPRELSRLTLMQTFRLSDNALTGTVPTQLRQWSFLETLDLHGCQLRGRLPLDHPFWASAKTIDLAENFFTGTLPTFIGRFSRLSKLFLQDNLINGNVPTEIGKLINLRYLLLDQNAFESLPSELGMLRNVEFVMLAANRLASSIPSEVGLLRAMRESKKDPELEG